MYYGSFPYIWHLKAFAYYLKRKIVKYSHGIVLVLYCAIILGAVLLVERRIANKSELFMQNEKMREFADIYYTNIRECVNLDEQILNKQRLELLKDLYKLEDKENTKVDAELMEKLFVYSILDVYGGDNENKTMEWFYDIEPYSIDEWLKTNKK